MNTGEKTILTMSAAALMVAGAAAPAIAETMRTEGPMPDDPLSLMAHMEMAPNRFVLDSQQDTELVRFKTPHDIDICIAKADPNTVFGTKRAVPVTVKWDNDVGVIRPGNCMSFDAKSVKLRPAAPLPSDAELEGSYRVTH